MSIFAALATAAIAIAIVTITICFFIVPFLRAGHARLSVASGTPAVHDLYGGERRVDEGCGANGQSPRPMRASSAGHRGSPWSDRKQNSYFTNGRPESR